MHKRNRGLRVFNGPSPIAVPDGLKQASARPFFNRASGRAFDVQNAGDVTEIDLYDEIGFWGVSAKDFRSQLRNVTGGTIRLRINSPGGDVFDGIAMFNDLVAHKARVEVEVTGFAASAASLIAMAGDQITIADNAFFMIHNAWTLAIGDRNAISDVADVLGQIDGALADTYAARTGMDRSEIVEMMDDETWLSAADARENGFADVIGKADEAKASFDLSCFAKVPDGLRSFKAQSVAPTVRDTERALRDAGHSRAQAKSMAARVINVDSQRDAGDDADHSEFWAELSAFTDTIERSITR
ncbi:MAG: head maturation protease, ClpP-related [Pseudomonadota bacterium]